MTKITNSLISRKLKPVLKYTSAIPPLRKWEARRYFLNSYKKVHGRIPDLRSPTLFTEKLCRRLYETSENGNPLFTRLSDKLLAREFAKEKLGERHLVKLLWSGKDPADIPFDTLPANYVIKTNHGSGGHTLVKQGNVDRAATIEKFREKLNHNFYWAAREYQYYDLAPQVMIEEFLVDDHPEGPLDYRFFCFAGQPAVIQVDNYAHSINPFYDENWNSLPLHYRPEYRDINIPRPDNLAQMLEFARALSQGFDFVRVDLYNIRNNPLFGEMTFTPVAGRLRFSPQEWDEKLGRLWL
jgi:hypothetical protein